MTGLKLALSLFGILTGFSSWIGGTIIGTAHIADAGASSVSVISDSTPITLALTLGGITTAAICAWKVSRVWSQIENTIARQKERIDDLEQKLSNLPNGD